MKDIVFITGGDENYQGIVELCVRSIQGVSSIPLIVYGFNCNVPFNYPGVTNRRIDIERPKPMYRDSRIYYNKIDASIDCINIDDQKTYIWIDADCVASDNINRIIESKKNLTRYPLCMSYSHDDLIHWRMIDGDKIYKGHGEELGEQLGIKRNNTFTVATGLYMFDVRSRWFFEKIINTYNSILNSEIDIEQSKLVDDLAISEERMFNVFFWEHRLQKTLPVTWVSKDYDNDSLHPKLKDISNNGFDIMFDNSEYPDPNLGNILFFHGQTDIDICEKQIEDNKVSKISDKLMIVAHPDDESIFGANLLLNEDGWKVICVTKGDGDNNDSNIRIKEFKKVMEFVGCEYQILNYPDDMNEILFDENELLIELTQIIYEKDYEKIVTHNQHGEYGHILHKCVNRVVTTINHPNTHTFNISNKQLDENTFKFKLQMLESYESQNTDLVSFKQYMTNEGIKSIN